MQSQRGLAQQATMLEEKLAHEQSVSEMQRNFISVITHEFRTPLTQIDAQAQRMTNLKDRLLPQDITERAGRIRAAVARIVRMIDQLVDTSRLMDGDASLFFHPRADGPCSRAARSLPRAAGNFAGRYDHRGLPIERLRVLGDPKLLFQAFSNLLANAIKYSPRGAPVILSARLTDTKIAVTVQDFGIGVPEKDRLHIFSRYYRGSNASGFVGTGIGLFLVATILDLHAGEIAVESNEAEGSLFTAHCPCRHWRTVGPEDGRA